VGVGVEVRTRLSARGRVGAWARARARVCVWRVWRVGVGVWRVMLVAKSKHSIFLPELVVSDLLPDNFPSWKWDTQVESVSWLRTATRQFFTVRKRRGCIVNSDNQALHQHELDDSRQVTEWSCGVIQDATRMRAKSTIAQPHFFLQICVPLLHNLAFRGNDDALERFLAALSTEFDDAMAHVEVPKGLWVRKSDVVHGLRVFEHVHLARNVRCTATRVLAHHPILFGGMVYACGFALAFLRLRWVERRSRLLMSIGVIPTYR